MRTRLKTTFLQLQEKERLSPRVKGKRERLILNRKGIKMKKKDNISVKMIKIPAKALLSQRYTHYDQDVPPGIMMKSPKPLKS